MIKKNIPSLSTTLLFTAFCLLLSGCPGSGHLKTIPVHFHDRHVLSFPVIRDTAQSAGALTLVLLDFHHDSTPIPVSAAVDADPIPLSGEKDNVAAAVPPGITSYNWVDGLLAGGWVKQVYWVSGRTLPETQRIARQGWLGQNREQIHIADWEELRQLQELPGTIKITPLAVSLDLDILARITTDDPDAFLQEVLDTVCSWQPGVITVSLSAAYQPDAQKAWHWLETAYRILAVKGFPFLEAGGPGFIPESREEIAAWQAWEAQGADYRKATFAPGLDLWKHAPASLWAAFRKNIPAPGDEQAAVILKRITGMESAFKQLQKEFPLPRLHRFLNIAVDAVERIWQGGAVPQKEPMHFAEKADTGIAVRFVSGNRERGCLAFYTRVKNFEQATAAAAVGAAFFDPRYPIITEGEKTELDVEVTVFGAFKPMSGALDFAPGCDALLLETPDNRTLLQPSLALERNWSAYQFLESLTHKAGLAAGSWQNPDVHFYKSPAVSLRKPYQTGK